MATISITAALEGLPHLRTFRTKTMTGDSFWRLSGPPSTLHMVPTWRTRLLAAHALNRQQYMPYCVHCGNEVTFEHTILRQWVHVNEAGANHVAEQTSVPESHVAPPEGLKFLVTHCGMPLAWVLNNGTIVVPQVPTEHQSRQARVVAAFGEAIDPKFL